VPTPHDGLMQQCPLEDHVIAERCAVPDVVRDETDVVRVRHVVLTQDHPAEVVLPNVGCARPECALQRGCQGALARRRVAAQNDQLGPILHNTDANGRTTAIRQGSADRGFAGRSDHRPFRVANRCPLPSGQPTS